MNKSDLKIFIGPARIGNIGSVLASALRERGIMVTHAINQISPGRAESGMEYDILLDFRDLGWLWKRLACIFYAVKFFLQHNTFIFLFGLSLLPYNLDLPILKLFHKKTIMWFVGSDIRHCEALESAAKKAGVKFYKSKDHGSGPKALKRKMRMIRRVERYVDYIITGPSIAQLLTRDYIGKEMANKIYLPLDICNIRYSNISNSRPIVVHAPSDDEFKGTKYVLEAINRLKSEGYDFEFFLFRNMSNIKVRETLTRADIAVDQLFATGPGTFAIESMAAGCAVLGGNVPEFAGFPLELPIIHTDPDNIYENLKLLLVDPTLRQKLGEEGRKYVEKYHDHRKVADDILALLNKEKSDITIKNKRTSKHTKTIYNRRKHD